MSLHAPWMNEHQRPPSGPPRFWSENFRGKNGLSGLGWRCVMLLGCCCGYMTFVINATFFAHPPQQANKLIFTSESLGKYFMLHNWQAGTASVVIDSSCLRFPAKHFCKNNTVNGDCLHSSHPRKIAVCDGLVTLVNWTRSSSAEFIFCPSFLMYCTDALGMSFSPRLISPCNIIFSNWTMRARIYAPSSLRLANISAIDCLWA